MAKDLRQLREEASTASAAGKHKRALECYLELEKSDSTDAQWPKRVAETYRKLGKTPDAVAAYERSAERYAQNGFLVQAIAVCKLILQLDPANQSTLRRLAEINAAQNSGPTRIGALSEMHPSLHVNPSVARLRGNTAPNGLFDGEGRASTAEILTVATERARTSSTVPPIAEPARRAAAGSIDGLASPSPAHTAAAVGPAASGTWPTTAAQATGGSVANPGPSGTASGFAAAPARPSVPPPPARGPSVGRPPGPPPAPTRNLADESGVPRARTTAPPQLSTDAAIAPRVVNVTSVAPRSSSASPLAGANTGTLTPADTLPPPVARTRTKPITINPGAPLDSVALHEVVPGARELHEDGSSPGIRLIPLGDAPRSSTLDDIFAEDDPISVTNGADDIDVAAAEIEEAEELNLDDIEEVGDGPGRRMSAAARSALRNTPLFSSMDPAAMETLVAKLDLVTVSANDELFHEGDQGDALFVVTEGEVAVIAEGPPRVEMQRLSAGAFFGEVALLTDTPRTATVQAVSDAELLRIGRDTMAALLEHHPDVLRALLRFVRERLVDRWTRTSPLFRPFDDSERTSLVTRFRFLEVDEGARIIAANVKPDGLYILLAGRADAVRGDQVLGQLGPGDLLGESALLGGAPINYDVRACGKCFALCLPSADFREIIMTHPHVLEVVGEVADARRKVLLT